MIGGVVVVLGRTGRNFAAGMSGGVAFVLDEDDTFVRRCNAALVELGRVEERADLTLLRQLVRRHARLTGSMRARRLLQAWDAMAARFVRVMPVEYRRALERVRDERAREPRDREVPPMRRTTADGRSEGLSEHPARGTETATGGRARHALEGVLRARSG